MLSRVVLFQTVAKTNEIITLLLSPLVIIITISDFRKAFEYILNYNVISFFVLFFIIFVFFFNLIHTLKEYRSLNKGMQKQEDNLKKKSFVISLLEKFKTRKVLLLTAGTIITSILILLYVFSISIKGFYYPIISSSPKEIVRERVDEMNKYILEKGYKDLELSVYCNAKQKDCVISPGGIHFSKESATTTLRKSERLIPQYTDGNNGRVIYYSVTSSFIRNIKGIFYRAKKVLLME